MHQPTPFFTPERLEPRRLLNHAVAATPILIEGVQPVAFDQPQIHAIFRRGASGAPLSANDGLGGTSFNVQAFLDTGTSGMLLSQETATGLGINSQTSRGRPITFSDVGVAGNENFDVSESLYTALAPFTPSADVDNEATYNQVYSQKFGPLRTEIARTAADDLIGPLDIIGMPALAGKVMVIDPTPANTGLDNIRTYIYNAGAAFNKNAQNSNPGIPAVGLHVKLSYGSFARFTSISPSGAPGPTLASNPFIGPNPVNKLLAKPPVDTTPPVTMTEGKSVSTGSFLFDTGAAASFISTAQANNLGVHYRKGTYNTDNPVLFDAAGKRVPNQFVIPLGGIGGQINAAGFFVDSLSLPTTEGTPVKFTHAPVLVADVTVRDPLTKQSLTLDGDFGMNYLVASADISGLAGGGGIGGLGDSRAGAFRWVTFDQKNGVLGLQLLPAWAGGSIAAPALGPRSASFGSAPGAAIGLSKWLRTSDTIL